MPRHTSTIAILLVCLIWWWSGRPISHGPGIIAPDIPVQEKLASPMKFRHKDFEIIKVARFKITARILSRADYRFDDAAVLSKTDLALGWGRMSDETVLKDISISQSGRFYYWKTRQAPIPISEIVSRSANMHLIAESSYVQDKIDAARQGNLVSISGYLVNVRGKEFSIKSSLRRTDAGPGACEVIWVEKFRVIK